MTTPAHEPTAMYELAENCGHIQPTEPEFPGDDGGQWAAWEAEHIYSTADRQRICLSTVIGHICPEVTR
jgi:hypothetical protein